MTATGHSSSGAWFQSDDGIVGVVTDGLALFFEQRGEHVYVRFDFREGCQPENMNALVAAERLAFFAQLRGAMYTEVRCSGRLAADEAAQAALNAYVDEKHAALSADLEKGKKSGAS